MRKERYEREREREIERETERETEKDRQMRWSGTPAEPRRHTSQVVEECFGDKGRLVHQKDRATQW